MIKPIDEESIGYAARIVSGGGLIVFPTDTVYGLGCDPSQGPATERLNLAKGREGKPLPVLCDSLESATEVVSLDEKAASLAKRLWPGALTIVAPARIELAEAVHRGTGKVGVRVPGHDSCRVLIKECDGRLVGTSANLSGRPPVHTANEAERVFGRTVDLILDGGTIDGTPSTVVESVGGKIMILRKGRVGVEDYT